MWSLILVPVLEWQSAQSWPEAEAEILSSEIEEHDGDDSTSYSAEFTYRYKVGGKFYTNDRYTFLRTSGSRKSARKLLKKYPVGSTTRVSYNPDDPNESVMDNRMGWRLLYALFPLAFIAVGGLFVWGGLVGGWGDTKTVKKRRKKSLSQSASQTRSINSLSPSNLPDDAQDEEFDGPKKLEPSYSPMMLLAVAGIFTLIWNGVIGFMAWNIINDGFPIFTILFFIPFLLVGIAGFGFCIYTFLATFNPKVEVALSNGAIRLGEEVDVAWEVVGDAARIRRLSITIEGQESATYRRGTDTITDTETFKKLDIVNSETTQKIQFGTATIKIPVDTMHSFDGGNNAIKWAIKVHGDIPRWPDINQSLEFRVRPRGC